MTITHRDISRTSRANPTPAQTAIWNEISGLRTGARFTRAKFRYGILCDFYCDSVRLAVVIFSKRWRLEDCNTLEAEGIHVIVAQSDNAILFPNKVFADVMNAVTFRAFVKSKPEIEGIDGVTELRYDKGVVRADVSSNDDQMIGQVLSVMKAYAPGLEIKFNVEAQAEVVSHG